LLSALATHPAHLQSPPIYLPHLIIFFSSFYNQSIIQIKNPQPLVVVADPALAREVMVSTWASTWPFRGAAGMLRPPLPRDLLAFERAGLFQVRGQSTELN
jgi:hypothetical protein